jgi:hypothetical protein
LTACQQCQEQFRPKRTTARFCSTACRMSAHRGAPTKGLLTAPQAAQKCVTGRSRAADNPTVPKSRSVTLPAGLVRDAVYPNMYRLVRPDGSLSDMVNLTRAKDALRFANVAAKASTGLAA